MPIPTPKKGDGQDKYVGRCMEFMADEDSDMDQDQKLAICYDKYKKWKKNRKKREKVKERKKQKMLENSRALVSDLKRLKEYYDENFCMGKKD
jgi:hypothetical protein